jgi:hypothetical protein
MRKLYVAPIVHPSDPEDETSYFLPRTSQMSYQAFSETVDEISEKLKNEKIDRIFIESSLRKRPVGRIKNEPVRRLCKNLGVHEIEKTESMSSFLAQLASSQLFETPLKKMFSLFVKRRDYEMARYVSKELKDGETGLILFGAVHRPECYVNMVSDDIRMRYVTSREEMFKKALEIMKLSSKGFADLTEDYSKKMFEQSA